MIRAMPTNSNDRVYCKVLGQSAVHGAFAGFTGFTPGLVNTHYVRRAASLRRFGLAALRLAPPRAARGFHVWGAARLRAALSPSVASPALTSQPAAPPKPNPTHETRNPQVYLPIPAIIQAVRKVNPNGRRWNRLKTSIRQPELA